MSIAAWMNGMEWKGRDGNGRVFMDWSDKKCAVQKKSDQWQQRNDNAVSPAAAAAAGGGGGY